MCQSQSPGFNTIGAFASKSVALGQMYGIHEKAAFPKGCHGQDTFDQDKRQKSAKFGVPSPLDFLNFLHCISRSLHLFCVME